jgi:hypothetical protein
MARNDSWTRDIGWLSIFASHTRGVASCAFKGLLKSQNIRNVLQAILFDLVCSTIQHPG